MVSCEVLWVLCASGLTLEVDLERLARLQTFRDPEPHPLGRDHLQRETAPFVSETTARRGRTAVSAEDTALSCRLICMHVSALNEQFSAVLIVFQFTAGNPRPKRPDANTHALPFLDLSLPFLDLSTAVC